jgi:hypothetical protein
MFFISYKYDDLAFVRQVQTFIQSIAGEDYLVWIDRDGLSPGDNWKNAVDAAIKQSIGVVVIITPEAITSPYVTYEWSYAMGLGKRVIPLLLREPGDGDEPIHAKLKELYMLMFNSPDESKHEWDALRNELKSVTIRHSVPPAIQSMKKRLYENIYDFEQRRQILKALQQFQHPAAADVLAEFIDAGLPELSLEAGIALASKTALDNEKARTGLAHIVDMADLVYASPADASRVNDDAAQMLIAAYDSNFKRGRYKRLPRITGLLSHLRSSVAYEKMTVILGRDAFLTNIGLRLHHIEDLTSRLIVLSKDIRYVGTMLNELLTVVYDDNFSLKQYVQKTMYMVVDVLRQHTLKQVARAENTTRVFDPHTVVSFME